MLLYGEKVTEEEMLEMEREEFDRRTKVFILSRQPMASMNDIEAITKRAWQEGSDRAEDLSRETLYSEVSYTVGWILDLIGLFTGELTK